jgi:DNA polymerase
MSDYYTSPLEEIDAANANLFLEDIRQCHSCPLGWQNSSVGGLTCPGWFPELGIDVLFVGMSPGDDETRGKAAGRPFVGRAGHKLMSLADSVGLLDPIIPGVGVHDVSLGFTNIVRCHTPSNRPPTGQEAEACRRWLDIELDMSNPLVVCLLGNSAIPLAFPGKKIGEVAGDSRVMTIEDGHSRIYIACYHPAAVLHRPDPYTEESIKSSLRLAREFIVKARQHRADRD